MSIFDKLDKKNEEYAASAEKLRMVMDGVNLRVSITKKAYAHRFYVLVDKLSAEDRAVLDNLLTHLEKLAEEDTEEITITHIKDGKKVDLEEGV